MALDFLIARIKTCNVKHFLKIMDIQQFSSQPKKNIHTLYLLRSYFILRWRDDNISVYGILLFKSCSKCSITFLKNIGL